VGCGRASKVRGATMPATVLAGVVLVGLAAACGAEPRPFTPSGQAAPRTAADAPGAPSPESAGPGSSPAPGTTPAAGEPTPAASEAASETEPPAADAFDYPEGFAVVYRTRPPGGVRGDGGAALAAFGTFWRAWWSAIASHEKDRRYLDYLAPKDPLDEARIFKNVVRSWVTEGVRPIGTVRAHRFRVLSTERGAVQLVGCGDETKVGTRNLASGAERWTFGRRPEARYKMYVLMERDAPTGRWRIRSYSSARVTDPLARECRT
jgi:hypothetical protein